MEATDDFIVATELEQMQNGVWTTALRQEWALWGPAGGYLSALVLRAIGEASEFPRPVSLTCQFLGVGKFEPVEIHVQNLRSGKRSQCLRADIVQEGRTIMTSTGWTASDDQDGMKHDYVPRIAIPQPDSLRSYEELYPSRNSHPFTRRLIQHPIDPAPEGDLTPGEPEFKSLFRFQPRPSADNPFVDLTRAMVLIDTFAWLATYGAHPTSGPSPWIAPTLDIYYRFHRPTIAHDWLYLKTRADLAEDSLISAHGEVRDLDGHLLVSGATQLLCGPRPTQFR